MTHRISEPQHQQRDVLQHSQQHQQKRQQQQQQGLRALDSSELRSLLLQSRLILSVDLGTHKTGLATAVRRHSIGCLSPAAAAAADGGMQQDGAAAERALLWASDLSSLFSVSELRLLQKGSSKRGSLLQLLLEQREQQQADLLLLGLPLNPCLSTEHR